MLPELTRLANIYFLVCAILQCIPLISPLAPATAVVPFIIVLSVSIIREGIEDYSRALLDKQQNNEETTAYRNGSWEKTISGSLYVGEIYTTGKLNIISGIMWLLRNYTLQSHHHI